MSFHEDRANEERRNLQAWTPIMLYLFVFPGAVRCTCICSTLAIQKEWGKGTYSFFLVLHTVFGRFIKAFLNTQPGNDLPAMQTRECVRPFAGMLCFSSSVRTDRRDGGGGYNPSLTWALSSWCIWKERAWLSVTLIMEGGLDTRLNQFTVNT